LRRALRSPAPGGASTNGAEGRYTYAMIVAVEVKRDGALSLLSEMEKLDLIRLNVPAGAAGGAERLSEQFAGALRLSDAEYSAFQNALSSGRNEWAQDIC